MVSPGLSHVDWTLQVRLNETSKKNAIQETYCSKPICLEMAYRLEFKKSRN